MIATSGKIQAFRKIMEQEHVDWYVVPTEDYHHSEYAKDYFKAREFLSGFTGSAGTLVISLHGAWLWTDGRYFIQANEQLHNSNIVLMKDGEENVPSLPAFLAENVKETESIGFDGRCMSLSSYQNLVKHLKEAGKNPGFMIHKDLVDMLWTDRPALSGEKAYFLSEDYAGESRLEKIKRLRNIMKEKNTQWFVSSSLDETAWLFNIRGEDVPYNPVVLSYAIVGMDTVRLFTMENALSDIMKEELSREGIETCRYEDFYPALSRLQNGAVLIDYLCANVLIAESLPQEVNIICSISPLREMKAVKNAVEISNTRKAHLKEGLAVTKFLFWLKNQVKEEKIGELEAEEYLEVLRQKESHYMGPSFRSIIAYGEHSAICHYSADKESSALLRPRGFVLCDVGGQYLEGTTDMTRTVALGPLTQKEKHMYTTVLRGTLGLMNAKFLLGCCGTNLDYLARGPLWEEGLDYRHGTGHGVGYFLNVHEGPNAFRWKIGPNMENPVLVEGMITSDEPGVYLEGQYGIRLENLILCKKSEKNEYGQFMCFETLTYAPFDLDAVLPEELSEKEKHVLNTYHELVYKKLSPSLEPKEAEWLREVTRGI